MRLIDADTLRDEVLNDNTFDNDTVNYYLSLIDEQPTQMKPNGRKCFQMGYEQGKEDANKLISCSVRSSCKPLDNIDDFKIDYEQLRESEFTTVLDVVKKL